jgi:hypothetical protein
MDSVLLEYVAGISSGFTILLGESKTIFYQECIAEQFTDEECLGKENLLKKTSCHTSFIASII